MVATMVGGVTMKIPEYLITFKVYYLWHSLNIIPLKSINIYVVYFLGTVQFNIIQNWIRNDT